MERYWVVPAPINTFGESFVCRFICLFVCLLVGGGGVDCVLFLHPKWDNSLLSSCSSRVAHLSENVVSTNIFSLCRGGEEERWWMERRGREKREREEKGKRGREEGEREKEKRDHSLFVFLHLKSCSLSNHHYCDAVSMNCTPLYNTSTREASCGQPLDTQWNLSDTDILQTKTCPPYFRMSFNLMTHFVDSSRF